MWVRNSVAMIKEDYLLRIIQELGRKIAELVERRTLGKIDEGIVLASALFREYAGGDCEDVAFEIDEEVVRILCLHHFLDCYSRILDLHL